MVMGSVPEEVDIAVVGGGVGGYIAAIRAAELGKSVALVEKDKLGGHCLNYACIPSKALLYIADIVHTAKNSTKFGISAGDVSVDPKKMYEWRMSVSQRLADGVAFLCRSNEIDVFKAQATFLSSSKLQLTDGMELDFKKAIIATGSVPIEADGLPRSDKVLSYKEALMLDYIPRNMAIIGAGYVAVEIGTMYAKLGSHVTVVARSDLLSRFDPEAVNVIRKSMEALGVKIIKGAEASSYGGGALKLTDGTSVPADIVVVAIGLEPYTDGLGLENTKVKKDGKGFITVDSSLLTSDPNIYAVGDATPGPMLAHRAMRQGVVAAEAASGLSVGYDNVVVPAVIFSDPEVAIAGILDGPGIETTKFPLSALGRAIALDTTNGFVKVAHDSRGVVRGIEIVSQDANSMISEAALAIEMGATLEDLADTIHPHPTYSEAVQEAAEAALGRPIHFFYGKK